MLLNVIDGVFSILVGFAGTVRINEGRSEASLLFYLLLGTVSFSLPNLHPITIITSCVSFNIFLT